MSDQFGRFLSRAMAILEEEKPAVFRGLCARLRGRRIRLDVDGTAVTPVFDDTGFALGAEALDPQVELRADRATILAVLDGETSLEDCVWNERVLLRGSLADVASFHEALIACVHGAVRCPSFPTLLAQYAGEEAPAPVDRRRS